MLILPVSVLFLCFSFLLAESSFQACARLRLPFGVHLNLHQSPCSFAFTFFSFFDVFPFAEELNPDNSVVQLFCTNLGTLIDNSLEVKLSLFGCLALAAQDLFCTQSAAL